MVDEVLFEHEAPALDCVEESLFEWLGVDAEPILEHLRRLNLLCLFIDLLVRVDLFKETMISVTKYDGTETLSVSKHWLLSYHNTEGGYEIALFTSHK